MIYYSTDYVFDGTKPTAYIETDATKPATVYGRSKLAGEEAVRDKLDNFAIMRIAWVYGKSGKNFVKTILKLGRSQVEAKRGGEVIQPLKVVDDQLGNPTWTEEIARQTVPLLESNETGLFHATSEGIVSWYRFALDIFSLSGLEVTVEPCTTAEFPRPAPRPRLSALENHRLKQLGLNRMRPYIQALDQFLKSNQEYL